MKKRILITGGTGDLGRALAQSLDDGDSCIYLQGFRHLEAAQGLAEKSGNIRVLSADLSDGGQTQALIRQVQQEGPLTHFVHLPALRVVNTRFAQFDAERFERDFSVQVRSALQLCQAFVPDMAKARFGRVLFVLTGYLLGLPPKNVAAYVTTKSALQGLARSLAADYAAKGVTVNCVAPAMVETAFLADTSELIVQASARANPMGRNAAVEDVVPAMRFLLSEEARFITGVTLPVTGGAQL